MKIGKNIGNWALIAVLMSGMSCASDPADWTTESEQQHMKEYMHFQAIHPDEPRHGQTRVTETAFEKDDRIGAFVCEGTLPLQASGNYVNNELLTYQGAFWLSNRPIYWNDGTYRVYAYYPYTTPVTSTDDMEWSVQTDQSVTTPTDHFEASDFLWASAKEVKASASPVALRFRHCMSKVTVRLVKGPQYGDDPLPADAEVWIHNTTHQATIDLEAGIATKARRGKRASIKARPMGYDEYAAIVVPQRVNRLPLFEVVSNGVSYLVEKAFVFKPGMHHIVSIILNRKPDQVKIEIGGEIENWTPAP